MRSERPALMSGPMVRAILEKRKTKTRRVMTPQPEFHQESPTWLTWRHGIRIGGGRDIRAFEAHALDRCPYGQPGDRLWVREAFFDHGPFDAAKPELTKREERIEYREDEWDRKGDGDAGGWSPSIHMPRWASRLSLEITDVRVERLNEISDADMVAEGITDIDDTPVCDPHDMSPATARQVRAAFHSLWNSLNAKRGYGWDVNPFVWAISFRQVDAVFSRPDSDTCIAASGASNG